LNLTSAIVCK